MIESYIYFGKGENLEPFEPSPRSVLRLIMTIKTRVIEPT